jgi:arginyl-tRNA synthetase
MLKLPSGKMSSRTGSIIAAEDLIDQVKEKVKGDEKIAIGAIKYMILRQAIGGDIIFDFEKSVSTEGDSGVYLQYSCVRAKSVLEKAEAAGMLTSTESPTDWQVTLLEKLLYKFPEVVLRSAQELQPHYVTNYLTELAQAFNSFYGNTVIINENDESSPYKLSITKAFSLVMQNGLHLLGIQTPERM